MEEISESWEQLGEKELDSAVIRLQEIAKKSRDEEKQCGSPKKELGKTSMAQPVIILKRPSTNIQPLEVSHHKPRSQIKSLPQRQKEYAEARKRILGSLPVENFNEDINTKR